MKKFECKKARKEQMLANMKTNNPEKHVQDFYTYIYIYRDIFIYIYMLYSYT